MHEQREKCPFEGNRVLAPLNSEERERLAPHLVRVDLAFKETLVAQGRPVENVFFPLRGVVSLVTEVDRGEVIETGTIGREGVVGLSAFLGRTHSPVRAVVQVEGRALRLAADRLLDEVRHGGRLNTMLLRYTNVLMAMLTQTAACNGSHALPERLARWLLMTHDRVDGDSFLLTQEFLGQMLGVQRPSVSLAGSMLQSAGVIRYSRGRIQVLDRARLEDVACECYARVRKMLEEELAHE